MLLELADDLIKPLNEEERSTIELLLHSRRCGYHLLTGSWDLFRALREQALSSGAQGILRKVQRLQVGKRELKRAVTHYVRVSSGGSARVTHGSEGQVIIDLRLSDLNDLRMLGPTVILGENDTDARLAEKMAKVYGSSNRTKHTKLRSSIVGGGGDTTAKAFRNLREEPRFCICVVDSDRRAPGDQLGATAKKVRREEDAGKPWAFALITRCRETENQLSARLIELAVGSEPQLREQIGDLERLRSLDSCRELSEYCDFKRGTSLSWVFSRPAGPVRDYWHGALSRMAALPSVRDDCCIQKTCRDSRGCRCWVVPPFTDKILERCLTAIDKMSTKKLAESLCATTRPHWDSIGSVVFSWSCGTEKTVV